MSIDIDTKKVSQITDTELKIMKNLSAYALPNTPANSGMKAPQVKPKFYDFALAQNGTSLYTILVRTITEINQIFESYKNNFTETEAHINTVVGNPHKVTAEEVNAYDKPNIDSKMAVINNFMENNNFVNGTIISQEDYDALSENDKQKDILYFIRDGVKYYKTTDVVNVAKCYQLTDGSVETISSKFEFIINLLNDLTSDGEIDLENLSNQITKLQSAWEIFIDGGKTNEALDTLLEVQNKFSQYLPLTGDVMSGDISMVDNKITFYHTWGYLGCDTTNGFVLASTQGRGIVIRNTLQNKDYKFSFPEKDGTVALTSDIEAIRTENKRYLHVIKIVNENSEKTKANIIQLTVVSTRANVYDYSSLVEFLLTISNEDIRYPATGITQNDQFINSISAKDSKLLVCYNNTNSQLTTFYIDNSATVSDIVSEL